MSTISPPRPTAGVEPPLEWASGPSRPRLAASELHVWRADLQALDDRFVGLLSADELARAERMAPGRALLWMRARGALRALLGRYLDRDGASLRLHVGAHGKPALGDHQSAGLRFNLSHSGQLALYAFAYGQEVGVDVQMGRPPQLPPPSNRLAVAQLAFEPSAARRLSRLAPAEREHEFLRLWTRHEAAVKCFGSGLRARNAGRAWARRAEPWVGDLDVTETAAGAVAMAGAPERLRCWEWRNR